jgi:hypothetical protein
MLVKSGHLQPSLSTLCKIGSILVHIDEGLSESGHPFDLIVLRNLLADGEVRAFVAELDRLALLPVKRLTPPPERGA